MKFLVFLILTSGLVSCVQVPESVTEDLANAAQEQSGSSSSNQGSSYGRDYDDHDDYEQDRCSPLPFVHDDYITWIGHEGGIEIGMNGEVLGDSTKPGRVIVQEGGKFSYGWRDRVIGEIYVFNGGLVQTPKHADIYATSGSTIDLSNGRDIIVYAEYGAEIVNQEYCRSCAIYYSDHVDVERACE